MTGQFPRARHALALLLGIVALASVPAEARVEKVVVHGASIEGNLEGNSPDRTVYVVLPDSYDKARKRRYPVLYFLHGFTATAERYMDYLKPAEALASLPAGREMIVVLPDSFTRRGGSMYAASPTVGDFERFVAVDLVGWVDAHYRTLARRESRGLAGHSMGGYGTLRIGMRFPQAWSSIYAMNACCLSPRRAMEGDARYETMDPDTVTAKDFADYAYFATAAAYSPNPLNPPYFFDRVTKDGKPDPMVEARWAANAPAVFVAQYGPALRSLKAIAMDVGDKDFLIEDNRLMHRELDRYGIAHGYAEYDGDHGNRVQQRFRDFVLPFFAKNLEHTAK